MKNNSFIHRHIKFVLISLFLCTWALIHFSNYQTTAPNCRFIEGMIEKTGDHLIVVKTKTIPSFYQVIPSPHIDKVNPEHMLRFGTIHPHFTVLLRNIMKKTCKKGGLFLDCGANFAYFSLFAASMGCDTISIEGNPYLSKYIRNSIQINNFESKIRFHSNIISDRSHEKKEIYIYPEHWGLSSALDELDGDGNRNGVLMETIKVDDLVQQDVFVMKIDIEGYELKALQSSKLLISKYNVDNIFVEWDKVKKSTPQQSIEMILWIINNSKTKYDVYSLPYEAYDEQITNQEWEASISFWERGAILLDINSFNSSHITTLWFKKKI